MNYIKILYLRDEEDLIESELMAEAYQEFASIRISTISSLAFYHLDKNKAEKLYNFLGEWLGK